MKALRVYGSLLGLIILGAASFAPVPDGAPRPAAVTAEETWTIPGAGRTPGQNNTFFVSDLALTNPGSSTASVTISFVGPGSLPSQTLTLGAGATRVFRDVVDALWDTGAVVGALSVHADQPLVLRARTYNTAATGTFGVALPVYSSGQLLAEGQTADSIWIQQDPPGSSGFRTNLGVVFPDAAGGEAVVTFFDATGAAVGNLNYSSAAPGFQQQSVASVAPAGLSIGRAQISVTRGHAAGYAVGVDNVTGDTSLYPLEALPAGVQDVVVSGVARLPGRNNTFFRTDARFYNPTPDDAVLTARFHSIGASNPAPQSATVTVPAGRIVESVDVLDSILHLPVGSGGALRFTSDRPVAILARTSNVDPQRIQPGTFGAQQKPVLLASYLSSADAGAVVTAIRQDASYRTNIGFAAGPDGAGYVLTLKNAQGAVIGATTGSLGSFGWAQPSISDLFPGTSIPADATLLVQVTSGTVDVYDASLDNASGDLVITPIAPVPATIPSSAPIGPAGGSIRSEDGRLTLRVPSGALPTPTMLSISPIENTAPNAIGSGYTLSPVGLSFAGPAQLLLAYSDDDLDGTAAGALGLASQNGNDWLALLGGAVDPVARTLFVPVLSTSPGPATASRGRAPMAAVADGNLGPYGSVRVDPGRSAVPINGTKALALTYVGPSSTGNLPFGFSPLRPGGLAQNALAQWSVADIYGAGPGGVGRITTSSSTGATYAAPPCPPSGSDNPVRINVTVSLAATGAQVARIGAWVRIVERDWQIEVIYRQFAHCGGIGLPGVGVWTIDYTRGHDGAFSLNDQLQVIDYLPGLTHQRTTSSMWCQNSGANCTQPVLSTIGDLVLADVEGDYRATTPRPFFILLARLQIPGTGAKISFSCGGQPFELPIFHGAQTAETVGFSLQHPDYELPVRFEYPGGLETVYAQVKPIKPTGCP